MGFGDEPASLALEPSFATPQKLDHLGIHEIIKVRAGGFSAAITEKNQVILWGTGEFGVFKTPQKICMDSVHFEDLQISISETESFCVATDVNG